MSVIGAPAHLVDDRVERQVRVDRGRAVTDQAGDVVHGPCFARLDHQAHASAQFLVYQEVVDGRDQQQGRYRGTKSALAWRSESTTTLAPPRTASSTWAQTVVQRIAQPLSGVACAFGRRTARRRRRCASRGPARPRSRTAGWPARRWSALAQASMIWWQERGPGSSRLPSGPTEDDSEVMSSSLMASSGGLVTWAKSWRK